MRRHLFASVGLVALLGLTACGAGSNQADSFASASASASPSVSASAAATASAPASPTAAESPAGPSAEPTVTPTPEPTATAPTSQAPIASQQLAAPGTNCGVADASRTTNSVYVFGGQVSCDEALSTMRAFLPSMTDNIGAQGPGSAEIGGFTCQESNRTSRETGTYATCINAVTAAYVELRGGVEPIPGLVADSSLYTVSNVPGAAYAFTPTGSQSGLLGCSTLSGADVTCEIIRPNDTVPGNPVGGYIKTWKVSMDPVNGVRVEEGGTQQGLPASTEARPLDVGTTINFLGFSCQPLSTESITCVGSSGHQFTISPAGVTQP